MGRDSGRENDPVMEEEGKTVDAGEFRFSEVSGDRERGMEEEDTFSLTTHDRTATDKGKERKRIEEDAKENKEYRDAPANTNDEDDEDDDASIRSASSSFLTPPATLRKKRSERSLKTLKKLRAAEREEEEARERERRKSVTFTAADEDGASTGHTSHERRRQGSAGSAGSEDSGILATTGERFFPSLVVLPVQHELTRFGAAPGAPGPSTPFTPIVSCPAQVQHQHASPSPPPPPSLLFLLTSHPSIPVQDNAASAAAEDTVQPTILDGPRGNSSIAPGVLSDNAAAAPTPEAAPAASVQDAKPKRKNSKKGKPGAGDSVNDEHHSENPVTSDPRARTLTGDDNRLGEATAGREVDRAIEAPKESVIAPHDTVKQFSKASTQLDTAAPVGDAISQSIQRDTTEPALVVTPIVPAQTIESSKPSEERSVPTAELEPSVDEPESDLAELPIELPPIPEDAPLKDPTAETVGASLQRKPSKKKQAKVTRLYIDSIGETEEDASQEPETASSSVTNTRAASPTPSEAPSIVEEGAGEQQPGVKRTRSKKNKSGSQRRKERAAKRASLGNLTQDGASKAEESSASVEKQPETIDLPSGEFRTPGGSDATGGVKLDTSAPFFTEELQKEGEKNEEHAEQRS